MASTAPMTDSIRTRWVQLGLGLIVMMAISSPQYVWTLFVKPLQAATGASLPQIQITFSILIVLQTWLSPAQGWLVERFGPRLLVALGAALSGLGWVLASSVTDLTALFLTYGLLCGVGTGIVYIGIVGLMARWFPDRRGLAIGMVAAGYGMGALVTTFPIDSMIKAEGHAHTLTVFGLLLGAVGRDGVLLGLVVAALADAHGLVLGLRLVEALAVVDHDVAELRGEAIPVFELDALLGLGTLRQAERRERGGGVEGVLHDLSSGRGPAERPMRGASRSP